MVMTKLVDNEYGIEYEKIAIKKLRIFRVGHQWLVEYQRFPRRYMHWDYFWWYNDGQYVEYYDALARVNELKAIGYVQIARFMKVKYFEVTQKG
jgi:hypothetical protein